MEWFGQDGHVSYDTYINFSYPLHFHRSLEFVYLEEGGLTVLEPKHSTNLQPGESVLFLPNEIHGYKSLEKSLYHTIVFPPEQVCYFLTLINEKKANSPKFRLDDPLLANASYIKRTLKNPVKTRGLLLTICGNYYEQVSFSSQENYNSDLLYTIVDYIGTHFSENPSLKQLSEKMGYDSSYISRYISKNIGIPFHQFLNSLRLAYAVDRLRSSDDNISDIALESGFSSIRAFNYNFQKEFGAPPHHFRNTSGSTEI